ncbi:MAG: toll/interleukin-1 receptor domain-containing protein, partial [Bacteroidetes bacterium]
MPTSDHRTHLNTLLAQGELGQAIQELYEATQANGQDDLHSEIILYSARYNSNERGFQQGVTSEAHYKMEQARLNAALQDALSRYEPDGSYAFEPLAAAAPTRLGTQQPKVFLSYSHQDKMLAQRVKNYLESAGYPVIIDTDDLGAGENIQAFIEQSVRDSQLTLSM